MASGAQYLTGGGEGHVRQWFGVYYGYIAVNVDPTAKGRVKLRVPQVLGNTTSGWALPMVAVSFVPQVGTPVSVMFVGGDPTQPIWFGNFALPIPPPVTINAGPPTGNGTQLGEIWYDSSDGMKTYEWNGASWIAYQIGTGGVAANIGLSEPSITGGTITGSQFIADGTSGEFLGYTGIPAAGNMNVSVSPVSGVDSKGNAYHDGVIVYDQGAYLQIHVNTGFGAPAVEMVTKATSATLNPAIFGYSANTGLVNEYIIGQWNGPRSMHDGKGVGVSLFSSAKDGSGNAAFGEMWTETNTVATWDDNGFHVNGNLTVTGTLNAGTGWVNMTQGADLVNWTVASGGVARYKLMPDNTVMVHMTNLVTNGFLGAGTAIWATPYPLTNGATQNFPVNFAVSGTPAALPQQPSVYMSGGDLKIGYLPANTTNVSLFIRYAID
jgi:hypothetical protein